MTENTRKSILEATLRIVGEGGFGGLTVRAIAERAGVAIGTVNYHFGSKDNAVAEAYRFVTADLVAAFAVLRDDTVPPEARLRAFAADFSAAVHAHGAALAFFAGGRSRGADVPPEYGAFALGEGLGLAHRAMIAMDPLVDAAEAAMRMAQFAGALLYPELVAGAMGLDMGNGETRDRYCALAAESLLPLTPTPNAPKKGATKRPPRR